MYGPKDDCCVGFGCSVDVGDHCYSWGGWLLFVVAVLRAQRHHWCWWRIPIGSFPLEQPVMPRALCNVAESPKASLVLMARSMRWWVIFIHKKINWYLLTLLLLHIVVESTTEMCVQLVCWIVNDRGWFQHRDGAVVMVNHGDGWWAAGMRRRGERRRERDVCLTNGFI